MKAGSSLEVEATEVEASAHRLMRSLAMSVPGDLGEMVKAILGVTTGTLQTGGPRSGTKASESASKVRLVVDQSRDSHSAREATEDIKPPARPIRWASSLLALCCHAYGRPVERAVPVGACLELLGITSSALDAAQDGHHDLMSLYGAGSPFSPVSGAEAVSKGTFEQVLSQKQPSESRSAALVSNASMTLIGLAWQALLDHGPRYGVESATVLEIGQLIANRLVGICHAQHLDLTVGRTFHLSLDEYERIAVGKTGEIDGTACETAAVLAGATAHRSLWRTLGVERAVAQQFYDDYVDLADDISSGGQIGHPVLYGLAVADAAQKKTILTLLERVRSGTHSSSEALQELLTLLREMGAEYYTLTCMVVHRKRAMAALAALKLPAEAHEWLYKWVWRVAPLELG